MALQVSSDAQLVFFSKVFGLHSPTTERVKGLIGFGVTFEVSLYNVRAFLHGKALPPVQLTIGSSALIKGTVDPIVAAQNKHVIEEWVAKLYQQQGAPQAKPKTPWAGPTTVVLTGLQPNANLLLVVKAVHLLFGGNKTLAESKAIVVLAQGGAKTEVITLPTYAEALTASQKLVTAGGVSHLESPGGQKVTPEAPKVAPKPVDAVIDLKAAQALGQKVHGTSTGSVYHTIALTDKVKVAARIIPGGSISIRTEWTDSPTADLKRLEEAGVIMKPGQGYGSIHFDPQEVPVQRVIGAFLVGTGIQWKAAVMNGAELVIGGK